MAAESSAPIVVAPVVVLVLILFDNCTALDKISVGILVPS